MTNDNHPEPQSHEDIFDKAVCGWCSKKVGCRVFGFGVTKEGGFRAEDCEGRFTQYPLSNTTASAYVTTSNSTDKKMGIDFVFTVCNPHDNSSCAAAMRDILQREGFDIVVDLSEWIWIREELVKVTKHPA